MGKRVSFIAVIYFMMAPLMARGEVPFPTVDFGESDLKSLIEKNNLQTIEGVAASLPEAFRMNSSFLKSSDSLQSASPANPRVLLWSTKGLFVLALTGEKQDLPDNTLEGFQFNRQEKKFHFIRQTFPIALDPAGRVQTALNEPNTCLRCHGSQPRPIWGEYPTWNNAFGSDDDFVSPPDLDLFQSFRKKMELDGLYRYFFPTAESPWARDMFPYRENRDPSLSNLSLSFSYRPNQRLGTFLSRLNAIRLEGMIEQKITPQQGIKLLSSVLSCDSTMPLEDKLAAIGMSSVDLDLRYTYVDPANKDLNITDSYFDGSATTRELLAARMLDWLKSLGLLPGVDSYETERTLAQKYKGITRPVSLDADFISQTDDLGGWIPIPYVPTQKTKMQKREPYRGSFKKKYLDLCTALPATS